MYADSATSWGDETMIKLKPRQRGTLIEKIPDLANLAAGALVFGQFLGGQPISPVVALLGIATWGAFMFVALLLGRKDES